MIWVVEPLWRLLFCSIHRDHHILCFQHAYANAVALRHLVLFQFTVVINPHTHTHKKEDEQQAEN